MPLRQLTHEVEDVAPSFGLLVPAGHSEQASSEVADAASPYLPERQAEQNAAPGGEKVPAVQIAQEADPLNENVPASQLEHVVDDVAPVKGKNFPAVQSAHS